MLLINNHAFHIITQIINYYINQKIILLYLLTYIIYLF